jgi:hypothetical protein
LWIILAGRILKKERVIQLHVRHSFLQNPWSGVAHSGKLIHILNAKSQHMSWSAWLGFPKAEGGQMAQSHCFFCSKL